MESDFADLSILVVGLGVIGGSYAMALKELKPKKIYGIDLDKKTIDMAQAMGIIDEGFTQAQQVLKKADLIIIALYPEDTIKFVKENILNFKAGAVITDTCGIKEKVVIKINSFISKQVEFIGAHPMAGKEAKGLQGASKEIFKDSNFIITPHERNSEKNIMFIEKLAKAIGCKNIIRTTPKEHDKIISFTSHLPHVLAVSLMNSRTSYSTVTPFSGGSFRDATRVANINSELWAQLFLLNSGNLIDEIEKFEETLVQVKTAVKLKDKDFLDNILKKALLRRREMVLK